MVLVYSYILESSSLPNHNDSSVFQSMKMIKKCRNSCSASNICFFIPYLHRTILKLPPYTSLPGRHALSLSHVQLFVTPWAVACQAPLSMGFPRQEYWDGLPLPPPGDPPDPGIKPASLACQVDSLPPSHQGRPILPSTSTYNIRCI